MSGVRRTGRHCSRPEATGGGVARPGPGDQLLRARNRATRVPVSTSATPCSERRGRVVDGDAFEGLGAEGAGAALEGEGHLHQRGVVLGRGDAADEGAVGREGHATHQPVGADGEHGGAVGAGIGAGDVGHGDHLGRRRAVGRGEAEVAAAVGVVGGAAVVVAGAIERAGHGDHRAGVAFPAEIHRAQVEAGSRAAGAADDHAAGAGGVGDAAVELVGAAVLEHDEALVAAGAGGAEPQAHVLGDDGGWASGWFRWWCWTIRHHRRRHRRQGQG